MSSRHRLFYACLALATQGTVARGDQRNEARGLRVSVR